VADSTATRDDREQPIAAREPSLAFARMSPYLVLLAPVVFWIVNQLVGRFQAIGPLFSLLLAVAVVMMVRRASRGALPDHVFAATSTARLDVDPDDLARFMVKAESLVLGIFAIVLTVIIMKQMTFPDAAFERAMKAIGCFIVLATLLGLALRYLVTQVLADHPYPRLGVSVGALLFMFYLIGGQFHSNTIRQQMVEISASADRDRQIERLGSRIYEKDEEGNTLLHGAAERNDSSLFEALLAKGFDINVPNSKGETPFLLLVKNSRFMDSQRSAERRELVQRLIDQGADIQVRDADGRGLLELAIFAQNALLIDLFMDLGLDLNARNRWGRTPFMEAVRWQAYEEQVSRGRSSQKSDPNPALLRRMIEKGADVQARDNLGESALSYLKAAPTVLEILQSAGQDPNAAAANGTSMWSELRDQPAPVVIATAARFPDIRMPVRPDGKPGKGPLHVFAEDAHPVLVEYGQTPLHVVARTHKGTPADRLKIAQLLIDAGAHADPRTSYAVTPLMEAARQAPEFVEFLIAQGADVNATARVNSLHNVDTPHSVLDWFVEQRNEPGVEVLKRAGARTAAELPPEKRP
jgi:ankyrin repeat protein